MSTAIHTRRLVRCSYCLRILAPGEGYVWRCSDPERCPAPMLCCRGWHAQCWDRDACRRRAHRRFRSGRAYAAATARPRVAFEQLDLEVSR
jgi:hypothetical protein